MKILITGICGFVGSLLATALRETAGVQVFGIDNLIREGSETNRARLRRLGIRFIHGDLRNASDVAALPQADWVIDAAANPSVLAGLQGTTGSRQLVEHNLQGTINLLEYCKQHKAGFILLSTSRVYSITALNAIKLSVKKSAFVAKATRGNPGLTTAGITEAFPTSAPLSLYGATKLASEALALEYGAAFDFPVWINRCGVLAGAGQFGRPDQGIFTYWIHAFMHGRSLKYIGFGGKGHQVRDCLHPLDLVPLIRRQMKEPKSDHPQIINVSGGLQQSMSLAQLSQWCAARFGERPIQSDDSPRPYDVPWLVMDSALAKKHWDWEPRINLESILEELTRHAEQNPDWLDVSGVA